MTALAALVLPPACETYPFVANMTLGPLGLDYVHIHYCSFSGLPFLSFSLFLAWLAALFYFRTSRPTRFYLCNPFLYLCIL